MKAFANVTALLVANDNNQTRNRKKERKGEKKQRGGRKGEWQKEEVKKGNTD